MTRFRLICLLLLFAGVSWSAPEPFPQAASDLKADPSARFGVLRNGLRYVILPNREPKERASLRLLIEAGSLFEKAEQRGLAHFLEHMAFNGSVNYAPGTLVEFFQRMGMNFGGDTNAFTSFDRTVYMLELPETKPATLAEGLRVFADYAGGLLLAEKEIERERGVILSEKRTRDSVDYRTFVAEFKFLLQGTLFPQRLPIGVEDVIRHATRDQFVAFYDAWYRPERMAVVVVGDVDVAAVESQIDAALSALEPRAPALPPLDYGRIASPQGVRVHFHHEPEAAATSVGIATVAPHSFELDTAANRLRDLPRSLAVAMINRRLSILAKKENASFTSGRASATEAYHFFRQASLELTCKPEQWAAALTTADHELRRALEHGFQEPERKEVVANFANALEQAVKTASTRRSEALASDLIESLADKTVFTTPADDLALFGPALTTVTVDDCVAALRMAWSTEHRYVTVSGNAAITGPRSQGTTKSNVADVTTPATPPYAAGSPEAIIQASYEAAHVVAVAPSETLVDTTWAYNDFGTPGTVTKREHITDLDVTLVTFTNGVRLNLKKTDFEANRIHLGVRLGTGRLTEPRDQPGLWFFTSNTFAAGGLGKHSMDDLQRILAGRTVGLGFRVAVDAFTFGALTNPDDLLLQFQLIAAYVNDPGYRPEALRQARKSMEEFYTGLVHQVDGPLQTVVPRLLANGDPRIGLPAKEDALTRTLEESQTWLAPQLASGVIEIAVVGDLDLDATIAAVAKTLGALPARSPRPELAAERNVRFPEKPFTKTFFVPTEIPKGIVSLYWPTTDANDVSRTRRLGLLAEVISDRLRLKVRQELGGAYSPGANHVPSSTFPGYGFLLTRIRVDPIKAEEIAEVVAALIDDIHRNGVTEDELDRAKKPLLTSLRDTARTNAYWLDNVLSRAQEKPEFLDWARSRYTDNEAISKVDLDSLAQTYLDNHRAFRVTVLPEEKK